MQQRPIEFRCWDQANKKMFSHEEIATNQKVGWRFDFAIGQLVQDIDIAEGDVSKRFELMQYTGLKDRHGKKVFEGDIVITHEWDHLKKELYKVCFGDEYVDASDYEEYFINIIGFYLEPINSKLDIESILQLKDLEVIGNVFEHKHLLGE